VKAARVSASMVGGTISAHNIQAGAANLGTMSGDIEFSGAVDRSGRYEFHAQSGDVRLGITGGFDLEASTFSGGIETDPALNIPRGSNRRSLRGSASGGGAAVVAGTFSGDIYIGTRLR
jgi:hypothetical protein